MAGRVAQDIRNAESPVDSGIMAALAALADPVRLRIILMLQEREQCVCHLTEALGLSQSTISHHMGLLKRGGLVQDRRDPHDGRWVYYRLDPRGIATLRSAMDRILNPAVADPTPASCCDPADQIQGREV